MEQTDTIKLFASTWGRLAATSVAHMTEHLYVGVITVALPVIASAMGLSVGPGRTFQEYKATRL